MKHLLKMLDLSTEDITEILNLADQLKYEQKHGIEHRHHCTDDPDTPQTIKAPPQQGK